MGMTFERDTSAQEHYEIELETVEKKSEKVSQTRWQLNRSCQASGSFLSELE